ncbi:MAG: response regulator transcription factor [Actinomycetia bacterium]|nr:response regulator transcription factor [Actinomycetes bacterium]
MRVLIVEDEPAYVDALTVALEVEGIETDAVGDGREAIRVFRDGEYDVVLLDLMLPSVSGLDVLGAIRRDSGIPVIVVSAKDGESDVVAALELGADDYLTKPYSVRELIARIRAVGRRSGGTKTEEGSEIVTLGNVSLDVGRYQLIVSGTTFDLPRKEFEVMSILMERAGRVVTRDWLLEEVWGMDWGDTKSLDQHIRRLRRKLETHEATPRILTIRGVGYRLEG